MKGGCTSKRGLASHPPPHKTCQTKVGINEPYHMAGANTNGTDRLKER